ncbi:MAG: hypothetical protein JO102_02775, partial [Elusimicrobia bacterium]|nr:hypothetical protein [Elusimicrobiota bacterium]
TMRDIVTGLEAALRDVYGANYGKTKFACITHSTGGLVARSWILRYYGDNMAALPMTHLISLAPPTNGSRLAELGKSRLSRLRSLIGIEPGMKILDALELGSAFQWNLNTEWMRRKLHDADGFFPFVIAGQWIDMKLWDNIIPATYERGSDGVVRASAANLNMQRISVAPDGTALRDVMGGIPFLVPPKTAHSDKTFGIMGSIPLTGDHPVWNGIAAALEVKTRDDHDKVEADWAMKTTALQRSDQYYDGTPLERYCQIVFRISDSNGEPIHDYALELIDQSGNGGNLPKGFFCDKHQNEPNPEMFVFYLDYDRLHQVPGGKLGFKIQAALGTPFVEYVATTFLSPSDVESIIRPNQTTLIDVVLRRRIKKNLFQLTTDFSEQPIGKDPGGPDDWVP